MSPNRWSGDGDASFASMLQSLLDSTAAAGEAKSMSETFTALISYSHYQALESSRYLDRTDCFSAAAEGMSSPETL